MDKSYLTKVLTGAILAYACYHYVTTDYPLVEMENGYLLGRFMHTSDRGTPYKAFYGIPYAKPPVGELRFEPPEKVDNWTSIRDAGYYGSQCIQTDIMFAGWTFGAEDCLYLNVFTPEETHPDDGLPVMLFIHGGYWHMGSAKDHGEMRFMNHKDVILVTINYRLGALGFLSTSDQEVRGNMGLKDQVAALKWVQRNIQFFGGDPNRVTIFGESAGAVSVHLHMMSPASKGLFQRAISQSGTAVSFFATNTHAEVTAQSKSFASKFSCPTSNNKEMIKCLKEQDAYSLARAHLENLDLFNRHRLSMFSPTVEVVKRDDSFLLEDPSAMLKKGDFRKIPWIVGVNAHEGCFGSSAIMVNETKQAMILKDWRSSLPKYLWYKQDNAISKPIMDHYLRSPLSKEEFEQNITSMLSDRAFFHPMSKVIRIHSKYAETYPYFLNYRTFHSLYYFFRDSESDYPAINVAINALWRWFKEFTLGWPTISPYTNHGDDLTLIFSLPWTPYWTHKLPERDVLVSDQILKLWTSFAKGEKLVWDDVEWKPASHSKGEDAIQYLEINTKPKLIPEPFSEGIRFWNSIEKDLLR